MPIKAALGGDDMREMARRLEEEANDSRMIESDLVRGQVVLPRFSGFLDAWLTGIRHPNAM